MTFELACEKIKEADMVLVSLGEEFDTIKALKQNTAYLEAVEKINMIVTYFKQQHFNLIFLFQNQHKKEVLSKKIIPPLLRLFCTQPITVTVSPILALLTSVHL